MLNMDLLFWGMENAVLACLVFFLFPLLALRGGQEEECWKIESRKHQGSLQIVPKDKQRTLGLCVCVCVCLIFNFLKGKKGFIFDLFIEISLCFCPNTFISYSVDITNFPLCIPLRLYPLIMNVSVLCSFIKWCFFLPKKVIIAFEHYFSSS